MPQENFEKLNKIILKTGIFILSLSILGKFAGWLFNMILTKYISTENYGIFTLAWGIVTFSAHILLFGIPASVSRYIAFYRGRGDKEKVNSSLYTGIILVILLILPSLSIFLFLNNFFPNFLSLKREEFLLVCFLFIVFSFYLFFNSVISGFRRPHISRLFGLLLEIFRPIFIALLIIFGISISIQNVVFVLTMSVLLPTLLSAIYVLKKFGLDGKFSFDLTKKFFKFGLPLSLTSTADNILGWADMFMIRIFVGFSALGVYYIANLTAAVELIFFGAFLAIFTPIITEHFGRKDLEGAAKLSSYLLENFFLFFIPIFTVFISFPREILVVLFRGEYEEGALAFQIMAFSMFLYGIDSLFTTILSSSGNPKKVASIKGIASVFNVIANLLLIPILKIEGAAIATVLSSLLMLLLSYSETKKIIKIKISSSRVSKVLISAFLTLPIVLITKKLIQDSLLSLTTSGIFLALSYSIFLLLFKALKIEDVLIISAILRKLKFPREISLRITNLLMKRVESKL
ncbi:MAG: oligosaccharide flippase family protein [Candidatus Altiarchaeota archaeon]